MVLTYNIIYIEEHLIICESMYKYAICRECGVLTLIF